MKTLKKISLLLFLSVLVSCGGSDEDLGISGEGSLSAKIDGTAFTALSSAVASSTSNNVLAVQGSNSNGVYIRINIMNYNGVGTYKTGDSASNASSMIYGTVNPVVAWASTFTIGEGTITVTEDTDTAVKGTFSFTGENNSSSAVTIKKVTEGTFNAPKQ
ncbi:hypothetical protein JL193_11230 [Polaribacter batillariae]|uniref:Lipoprotein n=1 Tax=Polaribacter batillariae TaxID=2808900 RepID=A0ABX7SSS4_9FLAO|nr:DUF6252 family protein [Polaribacter batillariae]QTD36709.1 hypothetical protein JL193_11230 [Polaribacter batillariae]